MGRLEKNIVIGWFTLIAIGIVFSTYKTFEAGAFWGILFLILFLGSFAASWAFWERKN